LYKVDESRTFNNMNMMLNLIASWLFLATLGTGFGQPIITDQPMTQATAPGATFSFQVGATGTAPLAYQWQKNPGKGFSDLADRANAALQYPEARAGCA
jgi:hypothetical protein